MGLRSRQGNLRLVFRLFNTLMQGLPSIRLNNLKTSLRFPCLGLNPIIDSINIHSLLRLSVCPSTCPYHERVLVNYGVSMISTYGASCSKLTTSLVNILLKFQMLISEISEYFLLKKCERLLQCSAKASHIFSTKNINVFGYKVVKHLTS